MTLLLDTGSSDIWVEVTYSVWCRDSTVEFGCTLEGSYTNTTSSTYQYVNSEFDIQYGDYSGAQGDYALETFEIGGLVSSVFFADDRRTSQKHAVWARPFHQHDPGYYGNRVCNKRSS